MGSVLPTLSGSQTVRAFERLGWSVPGERATLSVPDHRTVAKGTLRGLIRAAGVTVAEFVAVA